MSTPPDRPDEVPLPPAAERGASPRPAVRTARWRSVVGVYLLLVAVVGGIGALYWAIGPRSDTARNEFTRTVVQLLGGAALLASLYFTYRNLQVNLDTLLQNQQANLTDRFAKAVEQLASDKLEVRLGAIFALERLAKDSERDHATIMELLTAYVRERAPRCDGEEQDQQAGDEAFTRLATDIQAILTVIGRRNRWFGQGESIRLDLSRTSLARATLNGAHLEGAGLRGAHLAGADFTGADLEGAVLYGADLREADLEQAPLKGADISEADLRGADISGAHLERARLRDADLRGADIQGAHLWGTEISGADLRGAHLWGTNLEGVILSNVDLRGTDLEGVQLARAYLWGTNLEGADLRKATGLTHEQLGHAHLSNETKLPSYLSQTASVASSADTAAEEQIPIAEDTTAARGASNRRVTDDEA